MIQHLYEIYRQVLQTPFHNKSSVSRRRYKKTTINQLNSKRIKEKAFIGLICQFLKLGTGKTDNYTDWARDCIRGSIINPVANINLNELDRFMATYKTSFDKRTNQYLSKEHFTNQTKKHWGNPSKLKKIEKKLKALRNQRNSMFCSEPWHLPFRRIFYRRYTDDFFIGIIVSKQNTINSFIYILLISP